MTLGQALSEALGPRGWLSGDAATAPYARDWLDRYGMPPIGVARPSCTEEVAAVIRLCREWQVPVVPQGGGTGLVGGSVAADAETVLISLSRMNRIEAISGDEFTVTLEAGVVLQQLHEALARHGLYLPLHLGSEGSAQIGGLIATNAGGSHAFRYGTMMDLVLGLEVVLPDGRIWNGLRRLIKDNAGFQLRRLFCGSEGRLGVVTRAVLKLQPAPQAHVTALLALPDMNSALALSRELRLSAGDVLSALEFFDDGILGLTLKNVPDLKWPMQGRAPVYLLAELASAIEGLDLQAILQVFLEKAFEAGTVNDAVLAQSEGQRQSLWRLREELPEGSLREGRQLKHDISVPVVDIPSFLADCAPKVQDILPGTRIWSFGHLGDGNIHYNLSPPPGASDFSDMDEALNRCIYEEAVRYGGSFAAEHGIGRAKTAVADSLRSTVERDLMAQIHRALDRDDMMNPGVVI